jgi:hypothetical protein
MSSSDLHALADAVVAAREVLENHGEKYIAQSLLALEHRLRKGDTTAIMSAFTESTGSMGSLNDRVLSASNGDKIASEDEPSVNAQLRNLVRELERKAREAAAGHGIVLVR